MVFFITNSREKSYGIFPKFSKSVAYRFHYREATRTLKTEEIDTAH